jgi:para-nitrobenzyl esterase
MLSDPCSELLSLLELGERRPPPRVVLPGLGELEGEEKDGVHRFLAVPFAAPPCAELRWRPPQPPAPWAGVRKNPRVLPAALQPGSFNRATFDGHVIELCESCLVLNVFAPPPKPAEPGLAPLIFYIHGGAGKFGTCHDAFECSGQELARQHGICYVSPNYRLGALGFLAHPSLLAEDEQAASDAGAAAVAGCGNFAVCDLVRALEFVREHARSFGGDPNNVTIWGLSTGSQLVHALLNCPPAAGLFHRAVMQSCTELPNCRSLSEPHFVWQNKTAVEWGVALASRLGCGTSEGGDDPLTSPAAAASQMAALRRVSAARINVDEGFAAEAMDCYEPAIDKRGTLRTMKPLSALEMLQKGQVHRVPVMLGVTAHDGMGKCELEWTMLHGEPTTVSAYDDLLRLGFGPARLEDAKRFYGLTSVDAIDRRLGEISNDHWYFGSTQLVADLLARLSPGVFMYRVAERGFTKHGWDTPLWNGVGRPRPFIGGQPVHPSGGTVGETAMAYLATFARSGSPNVLSSEAEVGRPGAPTWEAHQPGADKFMLLGSTEMLDGAGASSSVGMSTLSPTELARLRFFAEYLVSRANEVDQSRA